MASEASDQPGTDGSVLSDTHRAPWHALGEGIDVQVLRYSPTTGEFALYVRMQPGARIAAHKHLSAGEFFVTKGELIYDVGRAGVGVYGYEAISEVHEEARAEVETEYLFLGRGAVAFIDRDGGVEFVVDWEAYRDLAQGSEVSRITDAA